MAHPNKYNHIDNVLNKHFNDFTPKKKKKIYNKLYNVKISKSDMVITDS